MSKDVKREKETVATKQQAGNDKSEQLMKVAASRRLQTCALSAMPRISYIHCSAPYGVSASMQMRTSWSAMRCGAKVYPILASARGARCSCLTLDSRAKMPAGRPCASSEGTMLMGESKGLTNTRLYRKRVRRRMMMMMMMMDDDEKEEEAQ